MTVVSEIADGPKRSQAYLFLMLTTLFWAGNAVAARIAVGEVSPMLLFMLRWSGIPEHDCSIGSIRTGGRNCPASRE
jgi:hypothetical protein